MQPRRMRDKRAWLARKEFRHHLIAIVEVVSGKSQLPWWAAAPVLPGVPQLAEISNGQHHVACSCSLTLNEARALWPLDLVFLALWNLHQLVRPW